MNNLVKSLGTIPVYIAVCNGAEVIFNGCSNTPNDYFTFTSGEGDEYCISKCTPKENNAGGTVKLIIPALVNGSQVSVLKKAFRWDVYNTDSYSALNVELVFQSQNVTIQGTKMTKYVNFPESLSEMFKECHDEDDDTKKKETNKISKTKIDLSGANISSATTFKYMFYNCLKLSSIDFGPLDTSNATDMSYMFGYCSALPSIEVSEFNTSNVTNFRSMFHGCYDLENLDVSNFDTNKATNMAYMFCKCHSLESLDLHTFITDSVTDMHNMFEKCTNLENLDVSSFITSNVTNMRYMFYECSSLENLDVTGFDTSEVTAMHGLFSGCSAIKTLDVSNFDTSLLTDAQWLFQTCENLELLRVSPDFVIPNTNGYMFENAKSDMRVIGKGFLEFIETSGNVKSAINNEANKVYTVSGDLGISESLRTTLATQLPNARFAEEIDPTGLFVATLNDTAYIGMNNSEQTIFAYGASETIAVALMNKTISGIGYCPANLQLTGSIVLSGNNSEFNEKAFIVGDGSTSTTITLTNPSSLPNTGTIVEANGMLLFTGTENYTLSNNITIKSGGYFNATRRIIISDGTTLEFQS